MVEIKFDKESLFKLTTNIQPLTELLEKLIEAHNQMVRDTKESKAQLNKELLLKFNKIEDRLHPVEEEIVKLKSLAGQHTGTLVQHQEKLTEIADQIYQMEEEKKRLAEAQNEDEETDLKQSMAHVQERIKYIDSLLLNIFNSNNQYKDNQNGIVSQLEELSQQTMKFNKCIEENTSKIKDLELTQKGQVNQEDINKIFQKVLELQSQMINFKLKAPTSKGETSKSFGNISQTEIELIREDLKNLSKFKDNIDKMRKDFLAFKEEVIQTINNFFENNQINNKIKDLEEKISSIHYSRKNEISIPPSFKSQTTNNRDISEQMIRDMSNHVNKLLIDYSDLKNKYDDLSNQMTLLKQSELSPMVNAQIRDATLGGSSLKARVDRHEEQIENIRRILDEIKPDLILKVNIIEQILPRKLNIDDLQGILQQFNDSCMKLYENKFADLVDTRSKIEDLYDKIRKLCNSKHPYSDDDILKELRGWSCATCEKNLMHLKPEKAAYYPWKKFPSRPMMKSTRGQGFSHQPAIVLSSDEENNNFYRSPKNFYEEDIGNKPNKGKSQLLPSNSINKN